MGVYRYCSNYRITWIIKMLVNSHLWKSGKSIKQQSSAKL